MHILTQSQKVYSGSWKEEVSWLSLSFLSSNIDKEGELLTPVVEMLCNGAVICCAYSYSSLADHHTHLPKKICNKLLSKRCIPALLGNEFLPYVN